MKNILKLTLLFLSTVFFSQEKTRIQGLYISDKKNECSESISLKIFYSNKKLFYKINAKNKILNGKLKITKDENFKYLHLGSIEGTYKNDTITFQNYGNSSNNYLNFKECKSKYLLFIKKKK